MNDPSTDFCGLFTKDARCPGIDGVDDIRFRLGFIDSGVGSWIYYDVRLYALNELADRLFIGQIAFSYINRVYDPQGCQCALKLKTDLSILSSEKNFHGHALYCLPTQF